MSADHYGFLRVAREATPGELLDAAGTLRARYDPAGFAGEVFRKVKELRARLELACETLTDPERRAAYDAELHRREQERQQRKPGAAERLRNARAMLGADDYAGAWPLLQGLAASHPNSAEVLCLLGRAESRRPGGDVAAGRDLMARALAIDPFHARSLRYLAELERDAGVGDAYVEAVRRLRQLDPEDPWLLLHGA
jgi:hypothetical protein